MSLNRSVPQPLHNAVSNPQAALPDYAGLVLFLIQPFLESPNSLSVDCEISPNTARVWIRVAFEGEDKGRVFGRGGRNIQAIRTVIAAAAALAGHSVYLDIYGSQAQEGERVGGVVPPPGSQKSPEGMSGSEEAEERVAPTKLVERPGTGSKPIPKPRPRSSLN